MALPTLDATFASSADLPRRQMLAKWLVAELGSGSIADFYTLPERYIYAKIAVAAGAPRGEADYVSLPKNYAWSDIYNAVAGLIPPSSVLVSGAGSAVNGTYTYREDANGKPAYNLLGEATDPFAYRIQWNGEASWILVEIDDAAYELSEDTAFPWQGTWSVSNGDSPAPTVTEIPQPSPNHTDWSEKQALGHIAAAYRGDTGNPANLATYIDWPWRYQVASIITELATEPELTPTVVFIDNVEEDSIFGDIPDSWQANNSSLTQLSIGNSATSIGSYAFYACGFTGSLTLENSVTSIGSQAFYYCSGFTGNLVIPNSVTSIGVQAFRGCSGFTGNLVIPNSVTSINDSAFNNCSGITDAYLNQPIGQIGSNAFYATSITNAYIGPDATGYTLGADQSIGDKSGITVSLWTNYPNVP